MATLYGQQYYGAFKPAGTPDISRKQQQGGGHGGGGPVTRTSKSNDKTVNVPVVGRSANREYIAASLTGIDREIQRKEAELQRMMYNAGGSLKDSNVKVQYEALSKELSELYIKKTEYENTAERSRDDLKNFQSEYKKAEDNIALHNYYLDGNQFNIRNNFAKVHDAFKAQDNSVDFHQNFNRQPIVTYKGGVLTKWVKEVLPSNSNYQQNTTAPRFIDQFGNDVGIPGFADYIYNITNKSNRANVNAMAQGIIEYMPEDVIYENMQLTLKRVRNNAGIEDVPESNYIVFDNVQKLRMGLGIIEAEHKRNPTTETSSSISELKTSIEKLLNEEKSVYTNIKEYDNYSMNNRSEIIKEHDELIKKATTAEEIEEAKTKKDEALTKFDEEETELANKINNGISYLAGHHALNLVDKQARFIINESSSATLQGMPGGSGAGGASGTTIWHELKGQNKATVEGLSRATGLNPQVGRVAVAVGGVLANTETPVYQTETVELNIPTEVFKDIKTANGLPLDIAHLNGIIKSAQNVMYLPYITSEGSIMMNTQGTVSEVRPGSPGYTDAKNSVMYYNLYMTNVQNATVTYEDNKLNFNPSNLDKNKPVKVFHTTLGTGDGQNKTLVKFTDEFKHMSQYAYDDSTSYMRAFISSSNVFSGTHLLQGNIDNLGTKSKEDIELAERAYNISKFPLIRVNGEYYTNPYYHSKSEVVERQYTQATMEISEDVFTTISKKASNLEGLGVDPELINNISKSGRGELIKGVTQGVQVLPNGNRIIPVIIPIDAIGEQGKVLYDNEKTKGIAKNMQRNKALGQQVTTQSPEQTSVPSVIPIQPR